MTQAFEFFGGLVPKSSSPAPSEPRGAAEEALQQAAPFVTIALALRAALALESAGITLALDLAVLALVWRMNGMLHRRTLPGHLVEPAAFGISLLLLLSCLMRLHLTGDASETALVVVLLVAAPLAFNAPKWFFGFAAAAAGGWLAAAWQTQPDEALVRGGTGLLGGVALGSLYIVRRYRRRRRDEVANAERRMLDEAELGRRERLALALDGGRVGHWYWNLQDDKFEVSRHWAHMLGYQPADIGDSVDGWFNRVHPYYLGDLRQSLASHLYGNTPQFECDYRIQHRDGTYRWALVRGVAERDDKGEPIAIAGVQSDVSELVNTEARMINDALNDKLTGLPNRRAFTARLERAVEKLRANRSALFAVVFLDLDRFKVVNDSMGHLVGDELLASVGKRLQGCRREGDVIARFGGDEFVALLEDLHDEEDAVRAAKRFRDALAAPFRVNGQEVVSGASIGIAFSNSRIEKADDMLRNADAAMYHAKTTNKGNFAVFNAEMYTKAKNLCMIQNDLGGALSRDELTLHYQPVFSLKDGRIAGAEALMRWRRPDSELVAPNDFIPLAEEMGLIEGFGEWALRTGCMQNVEWLRRGLRPIKMAVNLSAKQLQRSDFGSLVHRVLAETELDPHLLELELTESALMDSLDIAPATLEKLHQSGIHISIDDFGTGYSSLSYLRRFDFASLKIDRSFVGSLTTSEKSAAVARGLISLAHNLDLRVTAEGVESDAQLRFLQNEGCDSIQGFVASRPIEADEFERLLRADVTLDDIRADAELEATVLGESSVVA